MGICTFILESAAHSDHHFFASHFANKIAPLRPFHPVCDSLPARLHASPSLAEDAINRLPQFLERLISALEEARAESRSAQNSPTPQPSVRSDVQEPAATHGDTSDSKFAMQPSTDACHRLRSKTRSVLPLLLGWQRQPLSTDERHDIELSEAAAKIVEVGEV
ncbi:hypothetical protein BDV98DRAFT_208680 [Pterulicium gracile]|uniref:Uncharacterized protein n=1 Tax=Pterulicium gracile TaxID=1884261 RepID=A0A5C3QDQ5_9AGAR|nr:hypothetical protein BDV98DRAFT_208680 [Pterula gracilis]